MKLKIQCRLGEPDEIYLEPEDKINLFKHCSGGKVTIGLSDLQSVVELIEQHGERVHLPHVEIPEAKRYIRKSDGVVFVLNEDGLYYHEKPISTYSNNEEYYGSGILRKSFNFLTFYYE